MVRRLVPLAGFCMILYAAVPLAAQASPDNLESGWHIVRPGDTLEALADRYLGSSQFWKRLADLNREILNPDRIEPGQRLRVLIPMRGSLPVARIDRVSRKVEEQPQPNPWGEARPGDLLVERDAVRTYKSSSAVMDFRDGTSLMVTEDSLVFLNRTGSRLKGAPTHSVEIVEGQADVEIGGPRLSSPEAVRPEVEIVLGNTRARAKPAASAGAGQAQSRARKADGGGAKVMIYGGEGEVEAGGAKVQVPQGMGTSVEKEGPPGPPEPLLPAPVLASPAPGATAACTPLRLSWKAVPESVSYTVEICRDAACAELIERSVGATGEEWRTSSLPDGEYNWRVTARSRSGLDGYPSATSRVVVKPGDADTVAPTGSIKITGTTVRIADDLYVPPGVTFEVEAADGGIGLSGWRPMIDGQEAAMEAWTGPWPGGPHTAGATALDLCGNRGAIAPVSFIVDAEPPALSWKAEGPPPEQLRTRRGLRLRRARSHDEPGLLWVPSDPWGRLRWDERWSSSPPPLDTTVHQTVQVASDLPTIFLRLEGVRLIADGKPVPVSDGGLVRLDATDGGSRVEALTARTRSTGDGPVLEIEAVDGVGNISRQELRIERASVPAG
ncbi:MAG: LysM peptidoglycan-binding domain-containing protein [Acidobacteriota bacterium]